MLHILNEFAACALAIFTMASAFNILSGHKYLIKENIATAIIDAVICIAIIHFITP